MRVRAVLALVPALIGLYAGQAIVARSSDESSAIRAPGGLSCPTNDGKVRGMHVHPIQGQDAPNSPAATAEAALDGFVAGQFPRVDVALFRSEAGTPDSRLLTLTTPDGRRLAAARVDRSPTLGWTVSDLWLCASLLGDGTSTH